MGRRLTSQPSGGATSEILPTHQTKENRTQKAPSRLPHKLSNRVANILLHTAPNTNLEKRQETLKKLQS
jgi:hypothetical protein